MNRLLTGAAIMVGMAVTTAVHAGGDGKSEKMDLPLEGKTTPAVMGAIPDNDQMQREYPKVALAMSMEGAATMTCAVELDHRLDECRVDDESPAGLGFGGAALRLSAYFTVTPPTLDGRPVKGKLTIPIRFQLGDHPDPPPDAPLPPPTSPAALTLAREVVALDDAAGELKAMASLYTGQLAAQVVAGGDAAAGERVTDAYRQGLEDVIGAEVDRQARLMAGTMTADQLRTTLDYLKTPAGAAFRLSRARIEDGKLHDGFWRRVSIAAKAHLCERGGCPGESAGGALPAS